MIVAFFMVAIAASTIHAEEPRIQSNVTAKLPQVIRVATRMEIPPFVFEEKGKLTGFSIDLWEKIAARLGVKSQFSQYPSVNDLLTAIAARKADLGIAAISITSDREEKFDFSYPVFEAGSQIMVRSQTSSYPHILSVLFSAELLHLFGVMALVLLIPAHLVWFAERNHTGSNISRSYFPGIFEACWWAAATLATQADTMPRTWLARVMAVIWMFISVLFVAYFTAAVTSSLTVNQLHSNIKGISDLPGKQVVTIKGSTSAKYLAAHNIQASEMSSIQQTYDLLLNEKADAIVFDAPILLYYASHQGKGKVQVIGSPFLRESYGIAFPIQSPLRKPINEILLALQEDGTYQQLYSKWFGEEGE
jgi:polar amino acid transport system substrate-binding protein